MKKLLTLLIFFSALWSPSLNSGILSELNANNDHGIWFSQTARHDLPQDWSVNLKLEQRLGANYKKFYNYQHEAVFQHIILKGSSYKLSIGPGFNATKTLKKNTHSVYHWVWDLRPILEAYLSCDLFQWSIRQRLRGEYHDYLRNHYKKYAIYRHRLGIYTPWKLTCLNINPFISNEWFFRNNSYSSSNTSGLVGGYYLNHFRVGFDTSFSDSLRSTLAWQWRTTKQKPGTHPGWHNTFQYCINIDLTF